jgi:hypothetical protein
MSAQYPDVPDTPGVPPVLRQPGEGKDTANKLNSDKAGLDGLSGGKWGIYASGGAAAITPDNYPNFEYHKEWRIADYPPEGGNFESYDKVSTAFDIRIAMCNGGTLAERTDFMATLKRISADTELYNVVTPEETYRNVNIGSVRFSRSATNGATMITAEVQLVEIRQSATAAITDSRNPSGHDIQNDGPVQAAPAPAGATGTIH